ncbi:MAG: OmpA family protein [Bacteroidota bacterium]
MKILIKSLLIISLSVPMFSSAQTVQNLNAKQSLKMADYLFNMGSYFNAISYYERVYEKQANNAYAVNQIAQSQMLLRDYKEAEKWYKVLQDLNVDTYPDAGYYYALCLKYNSKYSEAKAAFGKFEKTYKGLNASAMKKKAKIQEDGCDLAIQMIAHPDTVKVEHLGANVNAPYTEFGPVPFGNDLLLYSSLKSDTIIVLDDHKRNQSFAQFYAVPKLTDSTFGESTLYKDMPINDNTQHSGNGSFSADKKRFYFTRCKLDETNMKMHCDIYMTEIKANGKWSNPVKLPAEINSDSTQTHPAIGSSKEGEVLYFSSNRAQGTGGMDIWYSVKKGDTWSPAMNVGKKINTVGDDITPFYDSKTFTLYFSSNGWAGMGGQDVFKAKGSLKKWEPAKNMGYPINSSVDDMYYTLSEKKYIGYVVSNRPGTISVKSETCCDDIWEVRYPRVIYYAVRGYVFDAKTKKELPGAKVIMVSDTLKWGKDQQSKIDTMYFWDTQALMSYKLKADKDGYFSNDAGFSVERKFENDTMRVDIYLTPIPPKEPIVIENIFYDFDKATLRSESFKGLDSLYNLLIANPTIQIEIRSHTDSKGNDAYNLKLSQGRAQSVVNYLINKGIAKERLVATGMGEKELLVKETTDDGKDCESCRQLNRRTDFKIIGVIPGKDVIYKQGDSGFDPDAIDTLEEQKDQDKEDK